MKYCLLVIAKGLELVLLVLLVSLSNDETTETSLFGKSDIKCLTRDRIVWSRRLELLQLSRTKKTVELRSKSERDFNEEKNYFLASVDVSTV